MSWTRRQAGQHAFAPRSASGARTPCFSQQPQRSRRRASAPSRHSHAAFRRWKQCGPRGQLGAARGCYCRGTPLYTDILIPQLDMITDVFNRLVESCHKKCISTRYAEPDLLKGESVCIDRYVYLFLQQLREQVLCRQRQGRRADAGYRPAGLWRRCPRWPHVWLMVAGCSDGVARMRAPLGRFVRLRLFVRPRAWTYATTLYLQTPTNNGIATLSIHSYAMIRMPRHSQGSALRLCATTSHLYPTWRRRVNGNLWRVWPGSALSRSTRAWLRSFFAPHSRWLWPACIACSWLWALWPCVLVRIRR